MKKLIFIAALLTYYNFIAGQTTSGEKDSCNTFSYFLKSKEELFKYIDHPCPNDSTCNTEISTAKAEIENGKLTFCMPMSMVTFELRQEQQLRKLCKSKGLFFGYEFFDCTAERGQTKGCYGLYMDKIITQKFGSDFKERLLKQADSLYIFSNPTVYYTQCDTLPRLFDKDIHESTGMNVPINSELFNKLKVSMYGYYPQVDIGFYIDKKGAASGYFLSQFIIYGDIVENNKYKNELTQIAFDHIRKFKVWRPGIILNQKVRTEYNVRISFVSESKM